MQSTPFKCYHPFHGPNDPCPPIEIKCFSTPPSLYMTFQPPNLKQFATAREALFAGTLWPDLYDPYPFEREVDST